MFARLESLNDCVILFDEIEEFWYVSCREIISYAKNGKSRIPTIMTFISLDRETPGLVRFLRVNARFVQVTPELVFLLITV